MTDRLTAAAVMLSSCARREATAMAKGERLYNPARINKLTEDDTERHERELAMMRRENQQLRFRCTALEHTIRTICKLAAHYANNERKPR
jgi:hypothetical protein